MIKVSVDLRLSAWHGAGSFAMFRFACPMPGTERSILRETHPLLNPRSFSGGLNSAIQFSGQIDHITENTSGGHIYTGPFARQE